MKSLALAAVTIALGMSAPLSAAPGAGLVQNWDDIIAPGTFVERLATGFNFTEGPAWHRDGYLLFTDIPSNAICKWTPPQGGQEGKNEIFRQPSFNANGLMFNTEGHLLACEHGQRRVSLTAFGKVVTIAENFEGKRLNSPNDLDIARDGSIYFTDPAYGLPGMKEGKELDFEGVYRLSPDGALKLLAREFGHPNGIAFSPDGKRLYVADSDPQFSNVRVFDVQPDGTLANGRIFADCKDTTQRGVPDGLKVDAHGNVFTSGPGGVWVLRPDGKLIGKIAVPEVTTNVAFGEADGKTLFITAGKSLYRVRLKVEGFKR